MKLVNEMTVISADSLDPGPELAARLVNMQSLRLLCSFLFY
jgi:hypothetical protein